MKISAGRDLAGYGAVLNETFLGGASWRFQDVGWDSFHVKVGWKILTQNHTKSMSVRSNSDVSVRCFFGHSLCVMPDALAEPFSHMSLPDLLILMSLGEFAPPFSVFVCFSYVFCGSYLFFSHSYTPTMLWPTYLVSLGTAVMTLRHSYSCFFKTLADFFPHQRLIASGLTTNLMMGL